MSFKPSLRARTCAAVAVPGLLVAGVLIAAPANASSFITVCASGCEQTTISAAVNAADPGDNIEVQGGTYAESVDVTKPLMIDAAPGTTVIPGPGYNDAGFVIGADGVTIRGFTIGNRSAMSQTIGIDVGDHAGVSIINDTIVNNQRGVSLNGATQVTVTNTRFEDNNGSGPDNNAALWGDSVEGIAITGSTFIGHTNTAINLAGSSNLNILANKFDDNGNVAVIWGDTHATVAGNTGTLMGGSGVFVTDSSDVAISDNDLSADTGTSGVSVSNAAGPSTGVTVTGNVFRTFARGVNVADGGLTDSLVASGNQFLTSQYGVSNQGTVPVNAQGNWWGDASGPYDPTAGDGSTPDTNAGLGQGALGAVDYSSWCVNDSCQTPVTPPAPAASTLQVTVLKQPHGSRVLKIQVTAAGGVSVDGGKVRVRTATGRRVAFLVVHHGGKARANLGELSPGTHVYTVVFRKTATVTRAAARITVRVP